MKKVKNEFTKYLNGEIDKVIKGEYSTNNDIKLKTYTPKVLTDCGVKNLPMLINQSHLLENIISKSKAIKMGIYHKDANYHNLGKETFIKAIESLDNPIVVMKSISKTGSKNTYIIVTDVKNKNEEQIIVPVYLETRGNYNNIEINTNKIKTIYGKKNIKDLVDRTIRCNINNIIYITKDKNKRQLITTIGLQLSNNSKTTYNNSITS